MSIPHTPRAMLLLCCFFWEKETATSTGVSHASVTAVHGMDFARRIMDVTLLVDVSSSPSIK